GLPHDLLDVHVCYLSRSPGELLEGDQAMVAVEIQTAEDLVRPMLQLSAQIVLSGFGRRERGAALEGFAQVSLSQLERRLQRGIAGDADPSLVFPAVIPRCQQLAQRTERHDVRLGELNR